MDYQELNSVWILKREFDRETRRLEDLHVLTEPSAPHLDGMPHAATPPLTSKVESIATLIIESEKSLVRIAAEMETAKYRLLVALQAVPMKELQQRVLRHHYVGCEPFNVIAKRFNYSRRHIINVHDAGIKALGLDVQTMIQFKKSL